MNDVPLELFHHNISFDVFLYPLPSLSCYISVAKTYKGEKYPNCSKGINEINGNRFIHRIQDRDEPIKAFRKKLKEGDP